LSLCSNFAAIPLPALINEMKPTWAELSVTALAKAACRYEVNGRERKKAQSHSLVFKSEFPAATCLPRPLQDSEYFAVFAKLTDDEAAHLKKSTFGSQKSNGRTRQPARGEGSGMKPLWRTSIPPADLDKRQGAGAMRKPANHKVKRSHYSVEHPGLLIIAALSQARHLLQ